MKKIFTVLAAIIITVSAWAQSPQKMSYQAVIRNSSNVLVTNSLVAIRINILQNTTPVYVETQTATTNANGLVTIEIGGGTVVSGVFASIDWSSGTYFIKTETDPAGGTNYSISGTSQLLSVPYAFYAKTAESTNGGINETDPVFAASPARGIVSNSITNWNTTYAWGNHANAGYLTSFTETDPAWTAASGNYYTKTNMQTGGASQLHFSNLTNKPTTVAGYGISDAMTTAHAANGITVTNITNWNAAYGWGNHSGLYRPVSYVPAWSEITSNPFSFSATANNQLLKYNSATSRWENWTPNFLTSYSETDPVFGAWNRSSGISITASQVSDFQTNVTNNAAMLANTAKNSYPSADATKLAGIAAAAEVNVNADWNATGGDAEILHKPIISSGTNPGDMQYWNGTSWVMVPVGQQGQYLQITASAIPSWAGASYPATTTTAVSSIRSTTATGGGNVTNDGGTTITARGVCWSTSPNPTTSGSKTSDGIATGIFTSAITGLTPSTMYYVRSYVTNSAGTIYGNELSFSTTAHTVPVIATQPISNITNTTAIAGGNITEDGGTPVLARGICWSLSANPTTANGFVTEGLGTGSYIALMTGLTANTLYHVRAYATNAQGTAYGNDLSFTTIVLQLASLTTSGAGSISYTTATAGGNVTGDNGAPVTSRGICWATTASPTTAGNKYTEAGGLGSFTANMTGLTASTTYYVRAFAVNGGGTSYGNQVSFITLTPALASLTTKAISGISSNLAGSGGVISLDGGSAITVKGVCWSLNPSPTIANSKTSDGSGIASYNSTMTGLNPLTLYYVRAYATNGLGTVYGNEISFTTTDLATPGPAVPVVGTSTSAITGSSTASGGGYVSSDGGSAVTARGVCWSTTANPTLANNFSTDGGSGLGFFTSTITGLSGCATVYYIRAYATNSTGTAYGNQNTVSTGLISILTTNDVTSIGNYTAVSGGFISDDGGCPVTQRGVCWNYIPGPTIGNQHSSEGAGSGAFVSNLTGLYANRTYYVRAYSTNIVGTSYGPEKVFTTTTPSSLYIGQNYAGGIIFYLDGTGLHGLTCASTDQGGYNWGCEGTSIPTGTALGTGATNTAAIVATCSDPNTAAKICDNLVLNGYSDWFLPSRDELTLVYTNLHGQGLGGFSNGWYWSSSEEDVYRAWFVGFDGFTERFDKEHGLTIRAVRAF